MIFRKHTEKLIEYKNYLQALPYFDRLYPENYYRFNVLYELLTIKYNFRLRVKIIVDEITPLNYIEKVFIGADWWENEVWDMFGIFFK